MTPVEEERMAYECYGCDYDYDKDCTWGGCRKLAEEKNEEEETEETDS